MARRRRLLPRDLLDFPLVNAPDSIPDPAVAGALENLGLFQTQPRQVEAYYTAVIRRFVEMGFGIGLVLGLPSRSPSRDLHEQSLSGHFGRVTIHLVWRKGSLTRGPAGAFAETIKNRLKR